jgi:hypothetical protein
MVASCRAAVFNEVAHGNQGRIIDAVGINSLKNLIDFPDPIKHQHVGIIDAKQIAHKGLKKMMVGIDQSRVDEAAGGINNIGVPGR